MGISTVALNAFLSFRATKLVTLQTHLIQLYYTTASVNPLDIKLELHINMSMVHKIFCESKRDNSFETQFGDRQKGKQVSNRKEA